MKHAKRKVSAAAKSVMMSITPGIRLFYCNGMPYVQSLGFEKVPKWYTEQQREEMAHQLADYLIVSPRSWQVLFIVFIHVDGEEKIVEHRKVFERVSSRELDKVSSEWANEAKFHLHLESGVDVISTAWVAAPDVNIDLLLETDHFVNKCLDYTPWTKK